MMWWGSDSSWILMWLMMALPFGGLLLLIVLALRAELALPPRRPIHRRVTDASEVLALRLARGEIDATEYLDRINALSQAGHT